MSTVAFIGLGAMGSRMAMNLHAAGHSLKVFNRSKEKTKQFADPGFANHQRQIRVCLAARTCNGQFCRTPSMKRQ